ncbi:MAG: DUF4097 domain-containing protein [Actinomycetota bacterium]|nr:DUF4097 domain-containing protein [Actinomycetota bacterium]
MKEFATPAPIMLRVRIPAGTVHVVAEERTTATVDLRPRDETDQEAWKLVEQARISLDGDTLVVEVRDRHRWFQTSELALRVGLPSDSRVNLTSASAGVHCAGRLASLHAKSASGDVDAEEVTGDASVITASGDVMVQHVRSRLRVKSASGDIEVVRSDGEVDVKVASGDVVVRASGGAVRAHTASGDVRVESADTGSLAVQTVSGDVRIGVRAGSAVWLDLTSRSGNTTSELPIESEPAIADCSLNINVRTVSGDISVVRAA